MNSALGLDEHIGMGHDNGIHLLIRHQSLIPAGIKPPGIDFPRNLLGPHPMPATRQQVHYSFFKFHRRGYDSFYWALTKRMIGTVFQTPILV